MRTTLLNLTISCLLAVFSGTFFSPSSTFAGEDKKYTVGENVTFKSNILNEERTIIVYLPASHGIGDKTYPVMYLLDGGYHYHHASGIVQFLSTQGRMPEMILVAITNVDRTRDFTPTHVKSQPTTGGGEKFLSFISDELVPFVNRNYRANEYKVLVGHSLGGLFAGWSLITKPELFNSYIAVSPYMMFDNEYVVDETESKLKSKYKNVNFYMTLGNEPQYIKTLERFEDIVKEKSPKGFDFIWKSYPNDDHGSVVHLSIYNGLEHIFSDWPLPAESFNEGLTAIDEHYRKLTEKYGYAVQTPEFTINQLGYVYLGKKETEKAISVFTENVKRFPESANVYDSLGEALENKGDLAEAKINYQKAVDLAENMNHPNLGLYKTNYERVSKSK